MPDRRSLTGKLKGAASSVAGTLGEGASRLRERAVRAKKDEDDEPQQITDQEKARLRRAEAEAREEAQKAARQEFVEEYREEIKENVREQQIEEMRRRQGLDVVSDDDSGGGGSQGGSSGRRKSATLPIFGTASADSEPEAPRTPMIGPPMDDDRGDDGGGFMLGPNRFEPFSLGSGFDEE